MKELRNIDIRRKTSSRLPLIAIVRGEVLPLSFAQQRLWFLAQMRGASAAYHMGLGLKLKGELDVRALRKSLDRILSRHEALRTTFAFIDEQPVQRISPFEGAGFLLIEEDVSQQEDIGAALEVLSAEEASTPFDLETGPLIRGRLIRLSDQEQALLISMHHIVSDGWSMGIFARELSALYAAFRNGQEDPLPELALQYADYAVWQREWIEGGILHEQADYWRSVFSDAPSLLELPTDYPRPAQQDYAGAFAGFSLDKELTTGLRDLSRRHGTTLFMTLLTGWAVLLSRLSGQQEVTIGTPVANRRRTEIENLIGFFVNTLALRIDLAGSPGVNELLARVKTLAIAAQQHQDIPFEQVVELVSPTRSLAHSPLFQVMFAWQNTPGDPLELPGLQVGSLSSTPHRVAKFDLNLSLMEAGETIVGGLEYATSLFNASTIERYLGYLRKLLKAMVADDTLAIDQLVVLSPAERRQLVYEWNDTKTEYPHESCVHELFEAQVLKTPEAPAVVFEDRELSYAELNRQANRLAHYLRHLGVKPDDRVAICVERSFAMIVALLAVLKAGGAYVPLDPAYPKDRLRFMLDDSAPVALLTQSGLESIFASSEISIPILDLEAVTPLWSTQPESNPDLSSIGLSSRHLAYVIYTSGSTGLPKGVMVEHANVMNLVKGLGGSIAHVYSDSSRVSMNASISFDASVKQLIQMFSGQTLVLIPQLIKKNLEEFVEFIVDVKIETLDCTPSQLDLLVSTRIFAGRNKSAIKRILVGGDQLSYKTWQRLKNSPSILSFVVYGPTECTVDSTIACINATNPSDRPHIGRPIANTQIYILDSYGEPVPVGVVGELYIGGAGVARGYLNRPELTAERFLPNPFVAEVDARMYRTGDLGRWLADGNIEFLGRNDFQVKIRGFRIELGEIEARLSEYPGIREAVVIAREDAPGDKRLVAYYTAAESEGEMEEHSAQTLRSYLSNRLPEYMVPAAYVRLKSLPLTPNGKLDRKALPEPETAAYVTHEYEPPQGEVETILAAIWSDVLRIEQVGRHDNFFELGGHSLLVVRVISRLRQALGIEVAISDLFARPVLADLAHPLEHAARTALPPITRAIRGQVLPLSFAQQRLWFLAQMRGASAAYHMGLGLKLKGELDVRALRKSLDRILSRHEALRTTFAFIDEQPVQRISPFEGAGFLLIEEDVSQQEDIGAALEVLSAEEASTPFDLETGPLIRGRLIRLSDQEQALLISMHHIVSDGWSMGIFARELSTLYAAFRNGQEDPLPELALQYADYAVWQREWIEGGILHEQADYWRSVFSDAPSLLELPTDYPRPAQQDYAGAFAGFSLDKELTTGLRDLSRRHGTTLFMTLLTGWAVLLSRLSGQQEVTIGTPVANRSRTEIENLIGLFVNTLALRIDLAGSPGVNELLARVKTLAIAAQQHQDIPFEQVVELVSPTRSLAHSPLFQVMFAWQNTPGDPLELPGLQVGSLSSTPHRVAKLDLSLSLMEAGETIVGGLEYATSLFNASTIERYLGYLRKLLKAMVADDTLAIDQLVVLSPAERRQLVYEWNDTKTEYPHESCVHELFEAQVLKTPEAPAVVFEDRELSYAELNRQANRLAHYLRHLGVKPDDRVAICVERSFAMIVALLAVLKAGGAYVPLDPAYPEDRLRFMLDDSAPVALLTQAGLESIFASSEISIPILDLEAVTPLWSTQPESNPDLSSIGLSSRHLAYVIYTSGSTGLPKGVMNEHRAILNRLMWMQRAYGLEGHDAVLQKTPFSFDISVWEFFWPLLAGARLVVAQPQGHTDPAYLAKTIRQNNITAMHFVPSMLQAFLDDNASGKCSSLEHVVCSGEALSAMLTRRFRQCFPTTALHNLYGPTEAAVEVTAWTCPSDPVGDRIPIGRPIANTQIYILDSYGEPVPVGVVGELYIGGVQVARGYLNRPELTAERFLPNPFVAEVDARMYRTGDLGRWLADGNIEFLGRNDFQVKIRGFRIELGEIEARLSEYPGIREAVVIAREDTPGDKRLVAYYTAAESEDEMEEHSAQTLRSYLSNRLPEYMVPAAYVRLKSLPLTPNGKLDRKALPEPETAAYVTHEYEPPQGEVETILAAIWSDVLRIEQVGRHDNFFELGGHSLLVVRVISRLRQALGIEVAISDLFARPVLADLAHPLEHAARTALPPITRAIRGQVLPLSFAQQRLWFLAQMRGASAAYHMGFGLKLKGELDVRALRKSLDRILSRHEALRTTFAFIDEQPVQRISPFEGAGFLLIEEDVSQQEDIGAALEVLSAEEASTPFDLETGPLIRGRLIRLSDQEQALLISMHHIVSDGWSMGIFARELSTLYAAFRNGQEDPLPELALQYADYAVWQREWIEGGILHEQADYWRSVFSDAPSLLELPTDYPRPAQQDYAGAFAGFSLDKELTTGLRDLSRRHGTTLFMTLLTGWAVLLSRLSGQQEVTIGTPVANRSRTEIENLIGLFVNTLALRIDLAGSPGVNELLARVKTLAIAAQQHQDIPFEQVVELVSPTRSLAHSPLFQVMFAWHNTPGDPLELPGLQVGSLSSTPHRVAKFDLNLSLMEAGETIVGGLEYATSLFNASTIERYLGYLRKLLKAMVADDTLAIDQLVVLSPAERRQLVYEWNDTKTEYPHESCVHELFEAQVLKTPEAPAVVFEDRELSYAELNRQANRLAHYLRHLGVKPDDRVAICVERSFAMIVALLAVLKAGGAYVPLDPAYPEDRLRFMLDDGAPVALLTQAGLESIFASSEISIPILDLEAATPIWSTQPESNPDLSSIGLSSRHLAYVIYTSGSTGLPKGVMVEHANVARLFAATNEWFRFNEQDVWTLFHSFAFDFSVWEIWGALLHGGRLIVVSKETIHTPDEFYKLICKEKVTVLNQTPSAFRQLILAQPSIEGSHGLRLIIFGGEALEVAMLKPWYKQNQNQATQLINMYGITETTVHVTYRRLEEADTREQSGSLIGCRIPDLRTYILDSYGEPVPVGVVGELYIGGAGVARGYLNRPELTAERFLPNPFVAEVDARMYRTGDLGRWLADGNIEFLGRNDFQVKIRGFRIELGEIEARLSEYPGIREAVVIAREDTPGDKRLVAYYTAAESEGEMEEHSAQTLRSYLSNRLPEYMVPAAYVRLKSLPLTPNGKLDRKALPEPETAAYVTHEYEPPQGEVETILAAIWSDVLRIEQVGRHDNFFELGGHSLLAITILERMRRKGLRADVSTLFSAPTLMQLAMEVGDAADTLKIPENLIVLGCEVITPEMLTLVELSQEEIERVVSEVPGGALNIQDIYPLAPLQEGILYHHLLKQEGDPYLLSLLLSFDTRARVDAYLEALQKVVDRHDILRTGVVWEGVREPVQVVWRKAPLFVEIVDLNPSGISAQAQLQARFDPRHHRINLQQAPLLRIHLAYDHERECWLMIQLLHHLIDDNTSLKKLQEEVQSYLLGRGDQLSKPQPFRNLVAQARLGLSREEHEAFFQKMLGDVEESTAPFGLLDVQGDGTGIEEGRVRLDRTLARRIRACARRLGVGTASLFHLAWARILSVTSGRSDVVFGTVLFGRMQGGENVERAMGLFINTLPIRISIDEQNVEASVRAVHKKLAELLRHEHASLALAQRCSRVPRPAPLFTALLNYRHGGENGKLASEEAARAWEGVKWLGGEERTNYPFLLSVDDLRDDFLLTAQTVSSIDPNRVCEFMRIALQSLVEALETTPYSALHTLDVLPAAERRRLVYEWNDTKTEYPHESCVHELFEAQVLKTPEAPAVVFEDRELSYAELNRQANRLAHYLRHLGVKPDDRVAICVERSFAMIVALLAVLKAGGAYVPLDPAYPEDRLRFMLDDSAPVALLTQAGLESIFASSEISIPILDLEAVTPLWSTQPESNPDLSSIGLSSRHLAYVIYTSGSTGLPKGVMVEHANVARLFAATNEWFRFNEQDVWTLFHSFAFDFSVWEIWGALLHGGRLIVVSKETIHTPDEFYKLICKEKVTVLNQTPSAFRQLILAQPSIEGSHGLRLIIFGGEALEVAMLKPWYKQNQNQATQLINMYGITETTVHVTYRRLEEADTREQSGSPIGCRIPDLRTYILDSYGEPVPVGVVGELYIGGAGVARGYLNRPELTAERFLPNPFVAEVDARMYRTGDLGRWLADGNIEFLGRNDFQVKIRGFRIELGEIEARLSEYPGIREAVVIAREDTPGDKRLVAYYTAAESEDEMEEHSAQTLRSYLSNRLPEYMVPAAYVRLKSLPLTPNGKLDRKALPEPETAAYVTHEYEPPQGEVETILAAIWSDVLRIEQVGRHDNFFELGGHSLLVVRVISRLRQALGIEVAISDLFARPVLADLAHPLEHAARTALPPITRAIRGQVLPLSFAQQRLWFLAQMRGASAAYHMGFGLKLKGELDVRALRKSLDRILSRHEALRTTFAFIDEQPVQRISPFEGAGFLLIEEDVSQQEDIGAALEVLSAEEASTPFDLETGPLIRGRLIRLSDQEQALLISMHHIVSDGWSMGIFARELSALYAAFRNGQEDPLPELALQYADYAVWQREWIEGGILHEQADYWRSVFSDAPSLLELPTDYPRPAQQDYAGAFAGFSLDKELTTGLRDLSRRHGTTLFMTLLTGWAVLLSRLSGQQEVTIGTPVANRSRTEIENLIGLFVNTLALRIDLAGSPGVNELLARVKTLAIAAQQHQDIPFEQVVELVSPTRSLAHSPLFQVMFAWQNTPGDPLELPGLQVGSLSSTPHRVAKLDLSLSLMEAGETIVGGLEYATSLFNASTIERYLGYLRKLLKAMVADDTLAIDQLVVLSPAERRQLVYEWNDTKTEYPHESCVHELFEAQVLKTPEAPAVVFEDRELSYAELNRQANRLAHYLRHLGVKPDDRVAICVERSFAMIVALLAVLKAGGAYVPLDPAYPEDRLRFMLDDSAPVALLTQAGLESIFASSEISIPILDLEAATPIWSTQPESNPDLSSIGLSSRHLAYVIYTSGSTGLPKGVMVEHQGLCNLAIAQAQKFYLKRNSRILQVASFSFDACISEVFIAISVGASLYMACRTDVVNIELFIDMISRSEITHLPVSPLVLAAVPKSVSFASVQVIIVAGEALDKLTAIHWARECHLVNAYGPTEVTVCATSYHCSKDETTNPPIGRPIANTQIYILDSYGEPVPVGVVGELYIGGAGVARGYLNRPELTAERFLPNPFVAEVDARMYRTGDLGRWLADGNIEFLGRNDFQVKIRGFRIELGEIEARLSEYPGIREAVVIAREDTPGDKRLVAYYTAAESEGEMEEHSAQTLRSYLSNRLPEYMVPAAYVPLKSLPLTPNGKLDRKALPEPETAAYVTHEYEPPQGEVETILAAIWSDVLRIEQVGRHDNFFELGGHSLLVVRVISRLRQALGIEVAISDLFARQILALQAEHVMDLWLEQFEPEDLIRQWKLLHNS